MKASKYQKFEMETVDRSQIRGAEYNPRTISADAKKRLSKMLAKHGLVQPLVWNRRTGNLVSGHQRLSALDSLEKSQDYALQVAVVDLSEREERVLNVQLNNPSMQGEWNMDLLAQLSEEASIAPSEMGFSDGDIAVMFGGDQRLDELMGDSEGVTDAKSIPRNSNTPAVCRKLIAEWGDHRGQIRCYGDASGGSRGSAKIAGSDWDLIRDEFRRAPFASRVSYRVPAANMPERARLNAMNARLQSASGEIRLMVDTNHAPHVVRDLEGVVLLKGGSGEIDKKADAGLTHISDALGYYVAAEFPTTKREVYGVALFG